MRSILLALPKVLALSALILAMLFTESEVSMQTDYPSWLTKTVRPPVTTVAPNPYVRPGGNPNLGAEYATPKPVQPTGSAIPSWLQTLGNFLGPLGSSTALGGGGLSPVGIAQGAIKQQQKQAVQTLKNLGLNPLGQPAQSWAQVAAAKGIKLPATPAPVWAANPKISTPVSIRPGAPINVATNPNPPAAPTKDQLTKSTSFQAWYATGDNAKYWDSISDEEKTYLLEALNQYGATEVAGYSEEAIQKAKDQYYLQQKIAANQAATAAAAAQQYYQPLQDLGQYASPFASQYNGWGYGGYGGGGYAGYSPAWLTNLTNWNIK